ncbi:MAG: hypothetical protein K6E93_07205 [Bacteroidales bacterium]|nr:hypothetical protein [Bacteroidales bacterium]
MLAIADSAGRFVLPTGRMVGAVLHLYAFLRSAKGRTSDSIHRALTL